MRLKTRARALVDALPRVSIGEARPRHRDSGNGLRGPLTNRRVRLRNCQYANRIAILRKTYMHCGAYYAELLEPIHGRRWEVVVRPHQWELL